MEALAPRQRRRRRDSLGLAGTFRARAQWGRLECGIVANEKRAAAGTGALEHTWWTAIYLAALLWACWCWWLALAVSGSSRGGRIDGCDRCARAGLLAAEFSSSSWVKAATARRRHECPVIDGAPAAGVGSAWSSAARRGRQAARSVARCSGGSCRRANVGVPMAQGGSPWRLSEV